MSDDEAAPTTAAIYARVSTADQDTESQLDVCTQHAENHDDIDEWTAYGDVQSGHEDDREDYVRLKDDIRDGQYDYFICSEFSRISRNDGEIKSFVADCLDRDMGFEVVQSSFSVAPDADDITKQALKIVADTLANIATMENLQKIDRIHRGIDHAREAGKWTGKAPKGFEVNDGYLQVVPDEFLSVRTALLEHHTEGASWTTLADAFDLNRSTLSRYYNNDEKRRLYIHADGYDEMDRIEAALKDANMKDYVATLDDTPDSDIDPADDPEPISLEEIEASDQAMMRTMQELLTRSTESDEPLDDEELFEIYEDNLNHVSEQ